MFYSLIPLFFDLINKVQIFEVKLYQGMTTSCAVPVLHSSAVLYNQIPWYLPRLQDNAVKGKNFYMETKVPVNTTMQQALQVKSRGLRVCCWFFCWFVFLMVISFRKAVQRMQSFQYEPQCH